MTSNAVLQYLRYTLARMEKEPEPWAAQAHSIVGRKLRLKHVAKAGHGGALDKLATGVLVVAFGSETKRLNHYLECEKEYLFTIRFGGTTDTFDIVGRMVHKFPTDHITADLVLNALPKFRGQIMQETPIYSMRKFNGQPLYKFIADRGVVLNLPPRPATVYKLDMVDFDPEGLRVPAQEGGETMPGYPNHPEAGITGPTATFNVLCSKGFYVRSLAHEIGKAVGSGAVVAALRRVRQGQWGLSHATSVVKLDPPGLLALFQNTRRHAVYSGPGRGETFINTAFPMPTAIPQEKPHLPNIENLGSLGNTEKEA